MKLKASLLICIFLMSFLAVFSGFIKPGFSDTVPDITKFNTCTTNIWSSGSYVLTNSTDAPEGSKSLDIAFTSGASRKIYPANSFYPQYVVDASSFINWTGTSSYLGFWFKLIADNYGINIGWFQYSSNVKAEMQFWYDAGNHYMTLAVAGWYGADYPITLNSWYWFELFLDDTANSWDLHMNGTSIRSGSGYDPGFTSEACFRVSVPGTGTVNENIRLDYIRVANGFEFPPTDPPTIYEWVTNPGFETGQFPPWIIANYTSYISSSGAHSGTYYAQIYSPEYLDRNFFSYYNRYANTSKARYFSLWHASPSSDGENTSIRLIYNDTSVYDVMVSTGENIDWHLVDLTSYLNTALSLKNFQIRDVQVGINSGIGIDDVYFLSTEPNTIAPAVITPYVSVYGENIDGNGTWVFTDWKYYTFKINVPNQDEETYSNLTDVGLRFNMSISQEQIMCDFHANNTERTGTWSTYGDDEWSWSFNSSMSSALETRFGQPVKVQEGTVSYDSTNNETDITFQIWFDKQCLDIYDQFHPVAIYALCNWASYSMSWFDSDQTFLVYSKGGFSKDFNTTNYAYANALAGEEWCSLYAYNGTTVSNTIWFRDLQHIKLLPQVDFLAGRSVFYITTYIEYSTGEGEWLPGWKNIIGVSYVSYTSIFASNVWINMTSAWFQGSGTPGTYDWVKTDNIYMFYHGSVGTAGNPGHWSFWIDMWFNNINASSTGGGRVNAYEFPMNDNADLWMRWLANNWGVKDNVQWTSNYMGDLKDTDGNIMNCQKIKMVRVKMELEVTQDASAMQLVQIHNYPVLDYTHSPELPLVGIQTPVFDETKMPNMGQTGLLGAVFSLFSGIGQWLSENVIFGGLNLWGNFVAFLDTIAGWLGAPKFFSNLFKWIADGFGFMVSSASFMFQLLSSFFQLIGALLTGFVSVLAEMVLSILNTLSVLTGMMGGTIGAAGNLWEQLGIWSWIQVALVFYPLYLVILWEEEGMDAVVSQLTMIWGIVAWLFGFFVQIIQMMMHVIGTLIESIPVAE
jgi:hypothetical protein